MIIETLTLGQVLAPIISGLTALILYHYIGSDYLGAAENEYWNSLRVFLLSSGDSTIRKKTDFALTNPARETELVGTVHMTTQELAELLEKEGYAQGVLSGLKYRPENVDPNKSSHATFESGSMAFRESRSDIVPDALAMRQVHVFWFDNNDSTLDVYAHEEYSSLNPLVAWKHYRAKTQNTELGKEKARAILEQVDIEIQ